MEADFDSIATQIQRQIESLVIQAPSKALSTVFPVASAKITEHIPTETFKELFQSQIAEFCSEDALESLIQASHQIIHSDRSRSHFGTRSGDLSGYKPVLKLSALENFPR
jgi:hypothetical protein